MINAILIGIILCCPLKEYENVEYPKNNFHEGSYFRTSVFCAKERSEVYSPLSGEITNINLQLNAIIIEKEDLKIKIRNVSGSFLKVGEDIAAGELIGFVNEMENIVISVYKDDEFVDPRELFDCK